MPISGLTTANSAAPRLLRTMLLRIMRERIPEKSRTSSEFRHFPFRIPHSKRTFAKNGPPSSCAKAKNRSIR